MQEDGLEYTQIVYIFRYSGTIPLWCKEMDLNMLIKIKMRLNPQLYTHIQRHTVPNGLSWRKVHKTVKHFTGSLEFCVYNIEIKEDLSTTVQKTK